MAGLAWPGLQDSNSSHCYERKVSQCEQVNKVKQLNLIDDLMLRRNRRGLTR